MNKSGTGSKVEIDVDLLLAVPTNTPDWQEICVTNISENLNLQVDTYYRPCDEGAAQNDVTGGDPQYDITVKGNTEDVGLNAILDAYGDYLAYDRNMMRFTSSLTGQVIEAKAPITAISGTYETPTTIEFSMSFKFKGKPTVT